MVPCVVCEEILKHPRRAHTVFSVEVRIRIDEDEKPAYNVETNEKEKNYALYNRIGRQKSRK